MILKSFLSSFIKRSGKKSSFYYFEWIDSVIFVMDKSYGIKKPNFFKKVYAQAKFWRNSKIRDALLRWVDKHIVPSEFMVQILSNWGANSARTYVLPHFAKSLKTA